MSKIVRSEILDAKVYENGLKVLFSCKFRTPYENGTEEYTGIRTKIFMFPNISVFKKQEIFNTINNDFLPYSDISNKDGSYIIINDEYKTNLKDMGNDMVCISTTYKSDSSPVKTLTVFVERESLSMDSYNKFCFSNISKNEFVYGNRSEYIEKVYNDFKSLVKQINIDNPFYEVRNDTTLLNASIELARTYFSVEENTGWMNVTENSKRRAIDAIGQLFFESCIKPKCGSIVYTVPDKFKYFDNLVNSSQVSKYINSRVIYNQGISHSALYWPIEDMVNGKCPRKCSKINDSEISVVIIKMQPTLTR